MRGITKDEGKLVFRVNYGNHMLKRCEAPSADTATECDMVCMDFLDILGTVSDYNSINALPTRLFTRSKDFLTQSTAAPRDTALFPICLDT